MNLNVNDEFQGSRIVADNMLRPFGNPTYKNYVETETEKFSSTFELVEDDAIMISIVKWLECFSIYLP